MPSSITADLTEAQLHALFDILTHAQTFDEILSFKDPEATFCYGYPFTKKNDGDNDGDSDGASSTAFASPTNSPILHMLLNKVVLSLPPARAVPLEFWSVRLQGILVALAEAELSESYDHGAMGSRKTLATASSAFLEAVGRGVLGGHPGGPVEDLKSKTYNVAESSELARAWDDVMREMVYGDLIEELFDFFARHQDIEQHSDAARAAIDYLIIYLAGFLHHICAVAAQGPYLVKLTENIQRLVPYTLVRQTLRISNAATMINGMMRLLLAKISVGGVTNWIGLTKGADDGMNLLQRIISMVLSWDASDFRKVVERVEKAKGGPSKAHLAAIKEHIDRPRAYHEAIRRASTERSQSVVVVILDSTDPELAATLSDEQHAQCMEYYSALLSIRDREAITNVLCRRNPDLFTHALKEVVAAFDPLIRQLHDKVDLKEHVTDAELFIDEFIEVSKGGKSWFRDSRTPPTVKDYVDLLRRNRHLLYKWCHRVASQTPEIRGMFCGWAKETIKGFRNPHIEGESSTVAGNLSNGMSSLSISENSGEGKSISQGGAGAMNSGLSSMFGALPEDARKAILPVLDAHAAYLASLDDNSRRQKQHLLDEVNGRVLAERTMTGPGMYLARWNDLLDETLIGPEKPHGPLRRGRDVKSNTAQGKSAPVTAGGQAGAKEKAGVRIQEVEVRGSQREAPDVTLVVETLRGQFKALLAEQVIG